MFVVGVSCCGWRTNEVTTAVEGFPTRSQSRGVRAGRCVNEIWIAIAVRFVGGGHITAWSQANEDKHTKKIVEKSIDKMQTRTRGITCSQGIKNMYQRTGGRGTPVGKDVKRAY